MVSSCSALGCRERAVRGNHVTFHRFPLNPLMREKWIRAVKRKDYVPTKNARICEKHFTPGCYVKVKSGRKILKDNAVPQIFDFSPNIKKKYKKQLDTEMDEKHVTTSNFSASMENVTDANTSVASVISLDSGCLDTAKNINSITFVAIKSDSCTNNELVEEANDSSDEEVNDNLSQIFSDSNSANEGPGDRDIFINMESNSTNKNDEIDDKTEQPWSITFKALSEQNKYKNYTKLRYLGDYKKEHLSSLRCRMDFICKVRSMAEKLIERFRLAKTMNQHLKKRKIFLENLLIRIKEADLMSNLNASDLIDCFLEEENEDPIEDSNKYDSIVDDLEYCNEFIELQRFCLEQDLLSQDNKFVVFGMYVASMLRIMPPRDAELLKENIELVLDKYAS